MGKNGSRIVSVGSLGDSVTERLPLSQVVILGARDQVPSWALSQEPASPLPMSLPLSFSLMNK